jgi:putative membrane protein
MEVFPVDPLGGGFGILAVVFFLVWVAFVVGLIALIALAIRWLLRNTSAGSPMKREDSALATLRERYARGEIDATEYEERKRTLGG